MRFSKYHGTGNDFVFVDDLDGELRLDPAFVVAICDRRRGAGADGLIRIVRGDAWDDGSANGSDPAFAGGDFFMDHFNADGKVAEMCGNGIRCLAKYVFERGFTSAEEIDIGTRSGIKHLVLATAGGVVERVTVNMGPPALERERIPMTGAAGSTFVGEPFLVEGQTYTAAAVSMGNPHCVLFLDRAVALEALDVPGIGRAVELREDLFPKRVNVEFVKVLDDATIEMRVWERGVGETMACGTGACAAAVAGALTGRTARDVTVRIPGGCLRVEWLPDGDVFMTGPATFVFEAELSEAWAESAGAPMPAKESAR